MTTIDKLEERIKQLENKLYNYPTIYGPGNYWYNTKKSCPKCGLTIEGGWAYVCNSYDCPLGMGTVKS